MIVCGVASTSVSRMSTWYMRSMPNGMVRWMPGSQKRLYLPRRSTSPRCVGRTMRMPERIPTTMSNRTMTMTMSADPAPMLTPFRARGERPDGRTHAR